jgi:hypothetical protein
VENVREQEERKGLVSIKGLKRKLRESQLKEKRK